MKIALALALLACAAVCLAAPAVPRLGLLAVHSGKTSTRAVHGSSSSSSGTPAPPTPNPNPDFSLTGDLFITVAGLNLTGGIYEYSGYSLNSFASGTSFTYMGQETQSESLALFDTMMMYLVHSSAGVTVCNESALTGDSTNPWSALDGATYDGVVTRRGVSASAWTIDSDSQTTQLGFALNEPNSIMWVYSETDEGTDVTIIVTDFQDGVPDSYHFDVPTECDSRQ